MSCSRFCRLLELTISAFFMAMSQFCRGRFIAFFSPLTKPIFRRASRYACHPAGLTYARPTRCIVP